MGLCLLKQAKRSFQGQLLAAKVFRLTATHVLDRNAPVPSLVARQLPPRQRLPP